MRAQGGLSAAPLKKRSGLPRAAALAFPAVLLDVGAGVVMHVALLVAVLAALQVGAVIGATAARLPTAAFSTSLRSASRARVCYCPRGSLPAISRCICNVGKVALAKLTRAVLSPSCA